MIERINVDRVAVVPLYYYNKNNLYHTYYEHISTFNT